MNSLALAPEVPLHVNPPLNGFRTGSRSRYTRRPTRSGDPTGLDWARLCEDYAACATAAELDGPFDAKGSLRTAPTRAPAIINSKSSGTTSPAASPATIAGGRKSRATGRPKGVPKGTRSKLRTPPEVEAQVVELYVGGEVRPGFLSAHTGLSKRTISRILNDSGKYDASRAPNGKYTAEEHRQLDAILAERLEREGKSVGGGVE